MTAAPEPLLVGQTPLTVRDVLAVLDGRPLALDPDPAYRARLAAGAEVVQARVASGEPLYGVTTGFGDSCQQSVPADYVLDLQHNLLRYHGCGVGAILPDRAALAVLVVRLASLARGWSGVRPVLLEHLAALARHRVLPQIPEHGSVGASGDLTPLSYVAAALVGEREVSFRGQVVPAAQALEAVGLAPLRLAPKEGLALMNGTSVMTALACLAWSRGRRLARLASAVTAVVADALRSNRHHFDPRIDAHKPHPGQRQAAAWIREDLDWDPEEPDPRLRLQDRYSIRCAPHVIGVLLDALDLVERVLAVEINSVNDNPLVDPDAGEFLNGGNFYGGHVAFVMDGLKTAVANVAGLLDRQMALLCGSNTNNGLPTNLVAPGADAAARHGFKAMQITASALAAQVLKNTMPASVFSRSTECHNQDVVSMGLHAARDAQESLDLAEAVGAVCLLAGCQGVELRGPDAAHSRARALLAAVRERAPMVQADRRQDVDIQAVLSALREDALPLGSYR